MRTFTQVIAHTLNSFVQVCMQVEPNVCHPIMHFGVFTQYRVFLPILPRGDKTFCRRGIPGPLKADNCCRIFILQDVVNVNITQSFTSQSYTPKPCRHVLYFHHAVCVQMKLLSQPEIISYKLKVFLNIQRMVRRNFKIFVFTLKMSHSWSLFSLFSPFQYS